MKKVAFNDRTIICVSKQGINYLDDERMECFIDFDQCHRNFLKEHPAMAQVMQNNDHDQFPKYVGYRDMMKKNAYMVFPAEPPIRFEFTKPPGKPVRPGSKFVRSEPPRGYFKFQKLLTDAGVTTFDWG